MNKPPFDPNQPFEVVDKPAFDPSQPFQAVDEKPQSTSNRLLSMVSDAVANTPLGLAAQGTNSINNAVGAITTPFIPVGKTIQNAATKVFNVPRSLGVGVARNLTGQSPADVTQGVADTMQGKTPQGIVDKSGAYVGENAPAVAASVASPLVGGPLAFTAQQAQSGKVSPVPLGVGLAFKGIESDVPKTAQDLGLKAFGDTKRFVNNPIKEAMARKSVQTLMDEGVMKPWSTTQDLVDRTSQVADKAGQAIGQHLKEVGQSQNFFDLNKGVDAIDQLRPRSENGQLLKGGVWDRINGKIDNAIDTIKAFTGSEKPSNIRSVPLTTAEEQTSYTPIRKFTPNESAPETPSSNVMGVSEINSPQSPGTRGNIFVGGSKNTELVPKKTSAVVGGGTKINWTGQTAPETASWTDANKIKGALQDLADYKSNKDASILDRVIAGRFREILDQSLENATANPLKHQGFLKQKQLYSAAMNQMDPLYNRLSSELGNKGISLTDWVLLAPEIATGNPLTAIASIGGKRLLEKFGPQTGASILNNAAKLKPSAAAGFLTGTANRRTQ